MIGALQNSSCSVITKTHCIGLEKAMSIVSYQSSRRN